MKSLKAENETPYLQHWKGLHRANLGYHGVFISPSCGYMMNRGAIVVMIVW
jgi:hypothetical protein